MTEEEDLRTDSRETSNEEQNSAVTKEVADLDRQNDRKLRK
jgi:hypothetical protein